MTTYNIGLNTGNTGSLLCAGMAMASPGSNQGGTSIYMGSTSASIINRIGLLFTSSVMGAGTVSGATLTLANADAMGATQAYELRSLINTFVQAQITWNNRTSGNTWNVAGALTGTDVNSTVIATGTAPTSISTFNITGAGLDAWVQGVLDGSITVPALILSAVSDTSVFAAAQNRIRTDTGTDGLRPVLTFNFTPATPPNATITDVTTSKAAGTAQFVVSLSTTYASNVTIDYTTLDGQAAQGIDYTATSGTLTFTPGQTSKTVNVTILP